MRQTKTHGIRDTDTSRYQIATWCGRRGYRCDGFSQEFDDAARNRFYASDRKPDVDCRTCLARIKAFEEKIDSGVDKQFATMDAKAEADAITTSGTSPSPAALTKETRE
ncbi:hypothetical protein [Shinella sp.]|uniref:hypothetical protein n=1 Tax=Shinella sp. TaxID=1870904 RepID=UPI0029AD644F|nr:hypothetical protein [Shinella sp.]MDX3973239.1 hypothetical protein [Shinella sp.]